MASSVALSGCIVLNKYPRVLTTRWTSSVSDYKTRQFVAMQGDGALAITDQTKMKIPHVLTAAGSDSGAGAGIQADLKACAARGVYCSTVLAAVTAQNTVGVQGIKVIPEEFVAAQLNSVLSDMQVDVVKTGMLPSVDIVKVLYQSLKEFPVGALVVDPVMVSTSGDVLAGPSIVSGFRLLSKIKMMAKKSPRNSNL